MRKIVKMFENGSVSVFGLRGKGKDLLTANVVCRRKSPMYQMSTMVAIGIPSTSTSSIVVIVTGISFPVT